MGKMMGISSRRADGPKKCHTWKWPRNGENWRERCSSLNRRKDGQDGKKDKSNRLENISGNSTSKEMSRRGKQITFNIPSF